MIKIKNWKHFQHFKDRRPPWIKLHRELLEDVDWFELPDKSAKILVMLWLIASEDETKEGVLPSNKKLCFRLRISEETLNKHLSILSDWLIRDDINTISERYQDGPPETETETEKEIDTCAKTCASEKPSDFDLFWKVYPKKKGKRDALKAWKQTKKERPEISAVVSKVQMLSKSNDWMKDAGQYIPYPASWLRAGGWDDEVEMPDHGKEKPRTIYSALYRENGELKNRSFRSIEELERTMRKDGYLGEYGNGLPWMRP